MMSFSRPTLAEPPLPLGSFGSLPDDALSGLRCSAAFAAFTPIAHITGQPAMSVPLSWNAGGIPVGIHFLGRFGDEATFSAWRRNWRRSARGQIGIQPFLRGPAIDY